MMSNVDLRPLRPHTPLNRLASNVAAPNAAQVVFRASSALPVEPAWSRDVAASIARPLTVGSSGAICGTSYRGNVFALDAETGLPRWVKPLGSTVGPLLNGPAGSLYAITNAGRLLVLDETNGEVRNSIDLGEKPQGTPILTPRGNVVCQLGTRHVAQVDPRTGASWKQKLDDDIALGPIAGADGNLYVFTYGLDVTSLDGTDGHVRWSVPTRTHLSSIATAPDGTVYAGASYGRIMALDPLSGETKWNLKPALSPDPLAYRDPHLAIAPDGTIHAGASNGFVFAVSPATRQLSWSKKLGREDLGAPHVDGAGNVLYGGKSGRVESLFPRWTFDSGGDFVSRPVTDGRGRWFVVDNKGVVVALEPKASEERELTRQIEAAATRGNPTIERGPRTLVIGGVPVPVRQS